MRRSLLAALGLVGVLCPAIAADDWPQFRGPDGQGHSAAKNVPLTWSEDQNIAWKVPIPGLGWSSPAIQGKQIWLTTALDGGKSLRALAINRQTGKTLHDVEVFQLDDPGSVHAKNSHASPTPVLDGDRVFVHFGAHGTACLSTDGNIVWSTHELKYNHNHGPGGSPVVWKDLLILSCDGNDVQFIVALDKKTGKIRWKRDREHISEARRTGQSKVPMAYTTPLLVEVDGRVQLLSGGSDVINALDPATGNEIWWANFDGYSNVSKPAFGKGLVFISSGYDEPELFAFGATGRGDVTESLLAWNMKRNPPNDSSPLVVGDELYVVSNGGIATCLDATSGEMHWQQRLGGNYSASATHADGRIYFLDEDGTTTVIEPGIEFKTLATNKLEGRTLASPAFVNGAIFLRTDTHLYRIGKRRDQ